MIKFLPTILNQLVRVLTTTIHEEVAMNTTRWEIRFMTGSHSTVCANNTVCVCVHVKCVFLCVCACRVMVHVVALCHEEGLEHYLRSYVKVKVCSEESSPVFDNTLDFLAVCVISFVQYVFKTETFSALNEKTIHEELARAMTAILKPSTDFLTSNKLLKVLRSSHVHQR